MGFEYIALSVFCSLLLAQIFKYAEKTGHHIIRILLYNYFAAFLISYFTSTEWKEPFVAVNEMSITAILLILLLGLVFIINLIIYSRSIHKVGMGISFAAMRMSLIFPIGVSLFVFGETLSLLRYAGVFLALSSLLLLIPQIKRNRISGLSEAWLPLMIFILTGIADTGMKVYEEIYKDDFSENFFLSGIFLASFIFALIMITKKKEMQFNFMELLLGVAAGIVNLYASVFLILALKLLPGTIVFPLVNVTLVVLGTVIGIYFWSDKLNVKQYWGLALAVISIILLV